MTVIFDGKPLLSQNKTGIAFGASYSILAMIKEYPNDKFIIQYIADKNKNYHLEEYQAELAPCYSNTKLYKLISAFFPLPYNWFFKNKADVTHFFNYIIPPKVYGKKVVTVHDMSYKAYPETVRFRTKLMLNLGLKASCRRADAIITDSQFSKSEIIKYLGTNPEKIKVVPYAVDTELFKPSNDAEIKIAKKNMSLPDKYFLYLGTIEPRKNIVRLLEAYSKLAKANKDDTPSLVLAGQKGWLYNEIFQKVEQLGLGNKIIFTGYIEARLISGLISGAVAFVFPSLYEGFGLPPLEAMACGTPVISSSTSSLPEVVGDAGILIDPLNTQELSSAMEKIWLDEGLRRELSQKGKERANTFTWQKTAELTMNVYKEIL